MSKQKSKKIIFLGVAILVALGAVAVFNSVPIGPGKAVDFISPQTTPAVANVYELPLLESSNSNSQTNNPTRVLSNGEQLSANSPTLVEGSDTPQLVGSIQVNAGGTASAGRVLVK